MEDNMLLFFFIGIITVLDEYSAGREQQSVSTCYLPRKHKAQLQRTSFPSNLRPNETALATLQA